MSIDQGQGGEEEEGGGKSVDLCSEHAYTGLQSACYPSKSKIPSPSPPTNVSSAIFEPEIAELLIADAISKNHPFKALIDSGSAPTLISPALVSSLGLRHIPLSRPQPLRLADGSIAATDVTHFARLSFKLPVLSRSWTVSAFICSLGNYDLVLGMPWIRDNIQHLDLATPSLINLIDRKRSFTTDRPPRSRNASPAAINLALLEEGYIPIDAFPGYNDPDDYVTFLKQTVPNKYNEFLGAFSKAAADTLPLDRGGLNHSIDIEPKSRPPAERVRPTSTMKLASQRAWIQDMIKRGCIRRSKSPYGANLTSASKPDGSLRWCIDYRRLNAITIKDKTPLPLISESLALLGRAKLFTRLDLRNAFNQVLMDPKSIDKTAFVTREGLFECLVMPFGLTNAGATFQRLVNIALHGLTDVICVVYLDDIVIFSEDPTLHSDHVCQVLRRLVEHGLYVKAEKCEFSVTTTKFLGHTVSPEGISMDEDQTSAISNYPIPTSPKQLHSFLGLANAYRRYIDNYAAIALPMNALFRKNYVPTTPYLVNAALESFLHLRSVFASPTVLRHFNPSLPTQVETDSSGYAIAAVLSQKHEDGLRPVGFWSRQTTDAERRYGVRDAELLAVVESVRHWSTFLEACEDPFVIYTDHQSLQYFQTSQRLLPRHVRWSQDLNTHSYSIRYRPARENCKADTLSRRPDYDVPLDPIFETILRPAEILATIMPAFTEFTVADRIVNACLTDPFLSKEPRPRHLSPSGTTPVQYHGITYVPPDPSLRSEILHLAHDSVSAGHPGRDRTIELVRRSYNWPGLPTDATRYVASCDTCQKSKPSHHRPHGLLKPLPIPDRPWSSISWDHIGPLPLSDGFDAILVIVDRFTKLAHFVPANTSDDARTLARQFLQNVFRLHGLPESIVSDRGATFSSAWWKELCRLMRTDLKLSTAFHPQTDGQTERTNQFIEHYLRCEVDYLQSDWAEKLDTAEFAYNNAQHTSTGQSPFHATYGFHPKSLLDHSIDAHTRVSPVPDAATLAESLRNAQSSARASLSYAQQRMKTNADTRRSPAPTYQIGDLVLIRSDHIKTTRPSRKLDDKNIGPFPITHILGPLNYRLQLGDRQIHNVFHVDRLTPYISPESFPGRPRLSRPPPDTANDTEYEVSEILDSRRRRGKLEYLVRWKGYGDEDKQWVPASEFDHDDSVVLDFARTHRQKPISAATKRHLNSSTTEPAKNLVIVA